MLGFYSGFHQHADSVAHRAREWLWMRCLCGRRVSGQIGAIALLWYRLLGTMRL